MLCVIFIVLKVRRPRELDELSTCHNALKFDKKCNLGNSHCLPQRIKSTVFEIFLNGVDPRGLWSESMNHSFFPKMLILVLEIIMQPSAHTFIVALFFHF